MKLVTMNLFEEIEEHPVCGDGAMGRLLMSAESRRVSALRNSACPDPNWSARFTGNIARQEPA